MKGETQKNDEEQDKKPRLYYAYAAGPPKESKRKPKIRSISKTPWWRRAFL